MNVYFLFGKEACKIYDGEGFKALVTKIVTDEAFLYATYRFTSKPSTLLSAYQGWDEFIEISSIEYDALGCLE